MFTENVGQVPPASYHSGSSGATLAYLSADRIPHPRLPAKAASAVSRPFVWNRTVGWYWIACLLFLVSLPIQAEEIQAMFGDFENRLKLPPAVNQPHARATAGTFYGGHVKVVQSPDGAWTEPSGGGYRLVESSFGQTAGFTARYPNFEQVAVDHALKSLYYDKADDSQYYKKNDAAFRYKALLYERTGVGIAPDYAAMQSLWNDDTRKRARVAAEGVTTVLRYTPANLALRQASLDILYDTAVAEITLAKEAEVESLKSSMGFPGYGVPLGEFAISGEIDYLRDALDYYVNAAQPYFDLLTDRMGVGPLVGGDAVTDVAFGYRMFQEQQPTRSLYASSFHEQDGKLTRIPDEDSTIFVGYKDLVLLFEIERDTARVASKLAKLLALRGGSGDREEANRIVGEAQQRGYTDGQILNGIFTDDQLAGADRYSGLKEARGGWNQGLTALSSIKSFIDGDANPLGLDPDFLALVQNNSGDSYGFFESLLIPGGDSEHLSAALGEAHTKYNEAVGSYAAFRQYQDQIGSELFAQRRQFGDRLRAIVGCEYPDPPSPSSCYHRPDQNIGGEIYLQLQNIELARQRILKNQQEILNLQQQIEHEIERRGREQGINDLIGQTYVRYGNKQAKLTEEIGHINAGQKASEALAKAAADTTLTNWGWGAAGHWANAMFQTWAENKKGNLNAQKERYSAQQTADIVYYNDQISAANSQALVKNLFLGMSVLAIESAEAGIVIAQEVGRLQALLDEKSYLETQWVEAEQQLGARYFADPSHRIVQNQATLAAGDAFEKAQFWVFALARALDYKWNVHVYADGYSADTVFKLRNARELVDMAAALYDYDKLHLIGARHGKQFVRFSLREDFLGYRRVDFQGNPLYYPDPVTGQSVDALTAFRSYLKHIAPHETKPVWGTAHETVRMQFSTAQPNRQGLFFAPNRWNEKINAIAVSINAQAHQTELPVWLEQSGTAFVRNEMPGVALNPDRPDLLTGEMKTYPVRYWYQTADPSTGELVFRSKNVFGFMINAAIVRDPDAPEDSWKKMEFHEMSPAISTWILEVPTIDDSNQKILDLDKVQDIEIWFYNYYYARN